MRRIFLVRDEIADILAGIKRGSGKNDWVLRKTQQDVTFERIAHMIALYSTDIRADAESRGLPVITMDGDFIQQMERALDLLLTRDREWSY